MPNLGDSVLECPGRHTKFCNIFQPGDHTSKGMKLCFVAIQSTMGRLNINQWSAGVIYSFSVK